jgi:protein-tyrosine kinase
MDVISYEIIKSNGSIGAILIDSGRLSPEDAEAVLRLQKERGLRFGDAAIELGFVSEQDIQHALASQYDYPYLLPGDPRVSESVIAAFQPFNKVVEQLRVLRSQLMLRWYDPAAEYKTIAVVSPGNREGRSFIAANLAVVFSQLGENTLLIDADLRNPSQHELFRLPNQLGLSSLLSDRCRLDQVVTRADGLRALSVLPAGPRPPNPQELLSRTAFSRLIDQAQSQYDVVIIDTPACADNADTQTITARCKGALVVARKDLTRARHLKQMVNNLQQSGARVVGSVMNNG